MTVYTQGVVAIATHTYMYKLFVVCLLYLQLDSVEPMQVDDPEDDTPIDFVVQPPNNFVRSLNNNLHTQLGIPIVLVLLIHCYQLYSIVLVISYCCITSFS